MDIAVDWITDKIYWTKLNQIIVYDLHTGYQATVLNITEPGTVLHQLVADPTTRLNLVIIIVLILNNFIILCIATSSNIIALYTGVT